MSKMRMPEMSVVRFTESDVIVASVVLTNWAPGDGDHNGTITKNGTTIFYNGDNTHTYINRLEEYGYSANPTFYTYPDEPYPYDLDDIIKFDNTGDGADSTNGTYYWNGTYFVKQ